MAEPAKKLDPLDPFEEPKKPPQKPDLRAIQGGKPSDAPSEPSQADLKSIQEGQSPSPPQSFDTISGKTSEEGAQKAIENKPDLADDALEEGREELGENRLEDKAKEFGKEKLDEAKDKLKDKTKEETKKAIKKVGKETTKKASEYLGGALWPYLLAVIGIILLIVLLIAVVIGIGFLGYNLSKQSEQDTEQADSITGEGPAKIVAIAQGELGTCERGKTNCGVEKYCNTDCEAWCASFVSWVYNEAGYPFKGTSCGWAIRGGADLQYYFRDNEISFSPGERDPQPGDLIGYKTGGSGHVGIVESYDPSTGTITTIEGNSGGGSDTDCVVRYTKNLKTDTAFRNRIRLFGRLKQFD